MEASKEKEKIVIDEDRYVTVNKFAKMCGGDGVPLAYSTISSNIDRGNLIESRIDGKKLLDLAHPLNADYLESHVNKSQTMTKKYRGDIETRKREVELQKAEEDLRIKRIERKRKEGELIPTELVQMTIKSHFKEAYQQFRFASEQIANDTIRKLGGGKKEIAEMKGALIAMLNDAIDKSREGSLAQVKSIEQDYNEGR